MTAFVEAIKALKASIAAKRTKPLAEMQASPQVR